MKLILAHSQPKSGSTFLFEVARAITEMQNGQPQFAIETTVLPPTRPNAFFVGDVSDTLSEAMLTSSPADAPWIIKTHGRLHPEVRARIEDGSVLAFTSFRDPRDSALAMLDAGKRQPKNAGQQFFTRFNAIADVIKPIRNQIRLLKEWIASQAVLSFPYYLIAADPAYSIALLCRYLSAENLVESMNTLFAHPADKVGTFNVGTADRFVSAFSPNELQELERGLAPEISFIEDLAAERMKALGRSSLYTNLRSARDSALAKAAV